MALLLFIRVDLAPNPINLLEPELSSRELFEAVLHTLPLSINFVLLLIDHYLPSETVQRFPFCLPKRIQMRSSTPTLSLVTRLTLLVSTSDTIALSFGFASTFIAIITVFVTRRAYLVPCLSSIPLLLLFIALFLDLSAAGYTA
jgi:hypothetical protein